MEYRIQQECTPNVSTERNRSLNSNYVNNCFDQNFLLGPVEIRVEKTRDSRLLSGRNKSSFYPGKFTRECIALKENTRAYF